MEGFRHHQGRPMYIRPTPETYAYQNLYGTVRSNPNGRLRPALDIDASTHPTKNGKKSFAFLPWRKNKKSEDPVATSVGTLSKHNKYKFGSVSALSSPGLYRDWDASSLSYTPSYSSSDLKHASIRSVGAKVRGLVTYPWETYTPSNNVDVRNSQNNHRNSMGIGPIVEDVGPRTHVNDVGVRNSQNNHRNSMGVGPIVEDVRNSQNNHRNSMDVGQIVEPRPLCKCQTKKSGRFGTLNLNSLKPSKCVCGFSSVRSTRGFAPPPPSRRKSILPEKVDLYAVHEDQVQMDPMFGDYRRENIYDTVSRHGKYRAAPSPPSFKTTQFAKSIEKCKKDPYSSVSSRKSILECDVTAYDLVKSCLKEDSDIEDDLSDNVIEGKGSDKLYQSPSPVSSESESGIYSQGSSVRIGGHGMKVHHPLDETNSSQLYSSEGSTKTNSVDSRTSSWSNSSDDGLYSLPEPDYDDVVPQDSERFSDTSSLRKYPSGGYLDSRASDHYENPRFSTIRKATSMLSLVGSEGGTLRGRPPRVPSVPEIPVSSVVPPPPPPPPPPPNFSLKNTQPVLDTETLTKSRASLSDSADKKHGMSLDSDTLTKSRASLKDSTDKCMTNSFSSSIANELAEKLKSNRPILKKNDVVVPKQPMTVNSHNPYAEVKSILKKTDKSANSSTNLSATDTNSPRKEILDFVKKKRVQFKSLSNESLLASVAESQKVQSLSSSDDEEWEEARETFSGYDAKSANSSTTEKVGFQTVGEFLKRQENGEGNKVEVKVPSKPSTIPRPTQPPPPPPNVRKGVAKGPPPPRPLVSAPKSLSHSDLRAPVRPMPGLVRITASKPGDTRAKRPMVGLNRTGTPNNQVKSENPSALPKNGVPSPAASPEVMTSSRGKPEHDHDSMDTASGDDTFSDSTTDVATKITHFNEKFSMTTIDGDTKNQQLNKLALEVATIIDDTSSESSYMSLPCDKNLDCDKNTICLVEGVNPIENNVSKSMTCTVGKKTDDQASNALETDSSTNTDAMRTTENRLQRQTPDWSSSVSLATLEGPFYSNLIYVPQPSPPPPPLPTTAPPPLPPKRSPLTRLTTLVCQDDDLYDVLPSPSTKKSSPGGRIYECTRYDDTGETVVTLKSGDPEDLADDLRKMDNPDQHIYCSLTSPVYEEVGGANKEPALLPNPFGRHRRSFFEGASKAEILRFLERAKERVVLAHLEDDVMMDEDEDDMPTHSKNVRNNPIRISNISSSSDSSTVSSSSSDTLSRIKICKELGGGAEVERADSGVGSETSKPSRRAPPPPEAELCADCDQQMELQSSSSCCPLVCRKCEKKRSERKEIVTEIVETEFKYGKDLLIIKEEFKSPMEVAGLLTKDQLGSIFLNLDELMQVNEAFAEKLKDATDIAQEQGDEDFTTVNIGKLFLETTTMLRAFELYCIRQGAASHQLTHLEKERELLSIFLRVTQMENPLLRRMNLAAFLMVPVQRVTKYPLLLSRLYKVTPYHHQDRESLREAQLKIELHLDHINQQTKGITGTKIWRRISNISAAHRRNTNVSDIGSIQLRKMALEVLEWSKEDIRFVLAGKLSYSGGQQDFALARSRRRGQQIKFSPSHALLATKGRPNGQYRPDLAQEVMFPRNTGIQDAALMLMKEKNGKYSLARDPLFLGMCIISAELEDEDIIEIQEHTTKESIYLRAECRSDTIEWLKQLRYHAKDLGTWKRRRNALANIMINGMVKPQ